MEKEENHVGGIHVQVQRLFLLWGCNLRMTTKKLEKCRCSTSAKAVSRILEAHTSCKKGKVIQSIDGQRCYFGNPAITK